jgi:glycosyltransferase involved in cell wall biosynthesis
MVNNKIISLALATYNMEQYLSKCLDSVLIPEVLDKIEVIIVNDGSVDNSLTIMQKYKERFPQSVVVIDKPNEHMGSCWNAALKIATGKYFRTLDPDDWFDSWAFIWFVNKLQNTDVDMVVTNFSREYVTTGKSKIHVRDTRDIVPGKEYFIDSIEKDGTKKLLCKFAEMHALTYKTQLLIAIDFKWTEKIAYTDIEYVFYPLGHIKNYNYLDIVLYKYLIGRKGQTVDRRVRIKNRNMFYILLKKMLLHIVENATEINIIQQHRLFLALGSYYAIILCHHRYKKKDHAELKEIDTLLKQADISLYEQLNNKTYFHITKYVRTWRNTGRYWSEHWVKKEIDKISNFIRS